MYCLTASRINSFIDLSFCLLSFTNSSYSCLENLALNLLMTSNICYIDVIIAQGGVLHEKNEAGLFRWLVNEDGLLELLWSLPHFLGDNASDEKLQKNKTWCHAYPHNWGYEVVLRRTRCVANNRVKSTRLRRERSAERLEGRKVPHSRDNGRGG
jgi:hypothetical protein